MRPWPGRLRQLFFPLLLLLAACDIEPVSVGAWTIATDTTGPVVSSTWTITADGAISVAGGTETIRADSVVLEGSRVSWSGTLPDPSGAAQSLEVNFNGTVNGDRLQGTLYTTLGNWSVAGTRQ